MRVNPQNVFITPAIATASTTGKMLRPEFPYPMEILLHTIIGLTEGWAVSTWESGCEDASQLFTFLAGIIPDIAILLWRGYATLARRPTLRRRRYIQLRRDTYFHA